MIKFVDVPTHGSINMAEIQHIGQPAEDLSYTLVVAGKETVVFDADCPRGDLVKKLTNMGCSFA